MFKVPEDKRIKSGPVASDKSYGNNGAFHIPIEGKKGEGGLVASVLASDGEEWEHVSVSFPHRTPTWEEMCMVKNIFWGEQDAVMQLHPPEGEYINNHEHCLHLWRPKNETIPLPDTKLVGVKNKHDELHG